MDLVAQSVYEYWFGSEALTPAVTKSRSQLWWQGSADIDFDIERRFGKLVEVAGKGSFTNWMDTPASAIALIVLNDQFPRNLYRGSGKAFAQDHLALGYAQQLVHSAEFSGLHPLEKTFSLMPFEHSENLENQEFCVAQFAQLVESVDPEWQQSMQSFYQYALDHRDIVRQFGRFPHRNKVLGRESTPEETEYLTSGGRRFGQ